MQHPRFKLLFCSSIFTHEELYKKCPFLDFRHLNFGKFWLIIISNLESIEERLLLW
jgi:hypothetical protein